MAPSWPSAGSGSPTEPAESAGYYDRLASMLDHAVAESFMRPEDRELIVFGASPKLLIDRLYEWTAPAQPATGKQLGP